MTDPATFSGKRFLGLAPEALLREGYDPARRIVPAWYGFRWEQAALPERFVIEVTARSQYKLWVNGQSLLFGPCRSPREAVYWDSPDIAPHLRRGENTLVLQVFSYPERPETEEGPYYCFGDDEGPAFSLEGSFGDRDPRDPGNWRAWLDRGQGFNNHQIFMLGSNETVEGALALQNPFLRPRWTEEETLPVTVVQPREYDDFGARKGKVFRPRPIPLLYRKERRFPDWEARTVPPHSTVRFVLDAGELTTAFFRIGFRGGKGAAVRLTYAESYFQKNEQGWPYKGVRDDRSGFIQGVRDEYAVGGDAVFEPFRFRTFRFVEVEAETGEEALAILPMPYIETAYPLENTKKPAFTDPKKEKLYDVAFRTLQLCAHDTYEDCPYYEQLQYACDGRLEILFTYAATDDILLPRQAIRLFAASMLRCGLTQSRYPSRDEQVIPAFALYYVMMLEDYVRHTGDLDFVRPYVPLAEQIVETFLRKRTESGLLAPQGYWDYFDWTPDWAAATPTAVLAGESALQNLFFVYAARSLCGLLPKFHRGDLAAHYEEECRALLRLVEERCWDEKRGLYREGAGTEEYTQHTQIYAVLTGLARGERARAIMEKVLEDKSLVPCSFMQGYYLFRALETAGMYDRTEALWQTWQDFVDLHCTTFPETPFSPRSDCHAWSALPLTEFAER